ncbi:Hypothetical protein PHPALM_13433 [Phytophthora palmivora]|uniref:Uncharacterized protein n=1 Tax=Phytophthora palmivora TaxID=4796 RepID=A0A2P4XX92_9STRA|nr:Hypothetical protein PHPALM_13433 [Phytophthora palmivora]
MAFHNDKKCRRCSCRNKSCQRRKAEQRRQGKCSIAQSQLLLVPSVGILFQHRRTRRFPPIEPLFDMNGDDELQSDRVSLANEDLQVMRDSVHKMQQQLRRGLRDIQEIRALVNQAAAQREEEKREMAVRVGTMTKRSPYELDGTVLLAVSGQRTRKKKRRESSNDCETEANKAWLASVLHTVQPNNLPVETQHNEVVARTTPLMPEKRIVQTQMSVEVLEQKKMLLPYLDKIEYMNCQLRWASRMDIVLTRV